MKTRIAFCLPALALIHLSMLNTFSEPLTGYDFKIVNMIPNGRSYESDCDSETNIAVNPANPLIIAGSAFTYNLNIPRTSAPIYLSSDGGSTWALNNILPSDNGSTGDVSLSFAASGTLYAGILRGGSWLRCMMLRTTTPIASNTKTGGIPLKLSNLMTTLVDRKPGTTLLLYNQNVDQPWISATTVNDATSTPRDRVFSGDNVLTYSKENLGDGKTAEVMVSNDAGSEPFSGFANQIVEVRSTSNQDMPAIRTAIHDSGVVYAVYYTMTSGSWSVFTCDVVVVRDDNFATSATPFSALTDAADSQPGRRVVTNVVVPAFFYAKDKRVFLGQNRLVASNLAIAVDPKNSANVFIAWCDRVGTDRRVNIVDYRAHFRRSTDSGQSWDARDWLTVPNATNPGIAVTNDGKVGIIYQQLTGSGSWETHFQLGSVTGTTFTDDILSTFLDSDLLRGSGHCFDPLLGDYLRIQAVGSRFYGVFPAGNRPDNANFPLGVSYQRNADFDTKQLRNLDNRPDVAVSVDPFFFKISPSISDLCRVAPELCRLIVKIKYELVMPDFSCPGCPAPPPCLHCPYVIDFRNIYETLINPQEKIILENPYFHLMLEGYDPQKFDIKIMTRDRGFVAQELKKTDKGYVLGFHPSKKHYSREKGLHDLDIAITANTEEAGKKGAKINYKLYVSDYRDRASR